ncbi:MAG: BatD family protein [Planctomycetales bacterium]|nr:BatD family protein [Planctomycetales bacterium]
MQHYISTAWRGMLLATLIVGGALHASAADVRVGISSKDAYVGMPVIVQVQVNNASDAEPPVMPAVDGLDIRERGAPSRSTQITTINGRTTKNMSLTYVYEVVPQRAGRFHIPPITVTADGRQQQTRAIDFVASKSETGDLMFVEVAGKEQQIYVGQALDLTLKIWLRPFRDAERNITLSAGDMWQMISPRSSWGVFEDRLTELANNRERPAAQEVLRKDSDGVEHSYYLYEIEATIYPKSPGQIQADDMHVIVEYPVALGVARDPFASMFDDMGMPGGFAGRFGGDDFPSPFGRRLTVESVRPIVADATVDPIDVRSIPTAGRPADYRGAVGDYQIVTEARPGSVKAGDPIELLIGIVGTGPMELVQAPPLAELPELTADFKVPSEPLAGFVQGDRKVFSTTIRPRKEGIAAIPAIPFTFFDPQQDQFVTVRSTPIAIHVDPADTLALDAIVGSRAGAGSAAQSGSAATSSLAPSFANDSGNDLLRSEPPRQRLTATLVFVLALPPFVAGAVWLARNRAGLSQILSRWGYGSRRAEVRLREAESVDEVALALKAYLARRAGLPANSKDAAALIGALRAAGQHKTAVRCEKVFQAASATPTGGVSRPASLEAVKHDALEALAEVNRHHERSRVMPTRRRQPVGHGNRTSQRASRVASVLILFAVLAGSSSAAFANAEPGNATTRLTLEQRQAVLAEASQLYDTAMNSTGDDSAEAKQTFADAAEKYQLLVDAGIANSRLYVNLANAYLQSGQPGAAIANYRRALKIDPTNTTAQVNLQHATQSVLPAEPGDAGDVGASVGDVASAANRWLTQRVSLQSIGALAIAGWFALWLVIGLRLSGVRFPWKTAATVAAVIAIAPAALYLANWQSTDQAIAVVTSPSAVLRTGDGDSFPAAGASLHEGESVELVKQRGDWLKIRLKSGQSGWVADRNVEAI